MDDAGKQIPHKCVYTDSQNTVTTKIEYNADTPVHDADDDCILGIEFVSIHISHKYIFIHV